jgi:hypothetical protein
VQCVAWKQKVRPIGCWQDLILKCVFSDAELPCQVCARKGLSCGAEDKLECVDRKRHHGRSSGWNNPVSTQEAEPAEAGPSSLNQPLIEDSKPEDSPKTELSIFIPRQPPTPADSHLTPLEAMCLQEYRYLPMQLWTTPLTDESVLWWVLNSRNCLFRRFGPNLSARAVRYSVVLLTARPIENIVSLEYLGRCYSAMRDAGSRKAFLELVYACFALGIYGMKSSQPWEEISLHIKWFWRSMENVVRISRLTTEERYWLVYMYYALLHKVCTPGGMQPAEVTHFLSATIIWRKGIIQDFRGTLVPFMF